MLRLFSIKSRLISLLVFMSVLLISVAFVGLNNLKRSKETLKTVYKDRSLSLMYLARMTKIYMSDVIKPILLFEEGRISIEEVIEQFSQAEKDVHSQWKAHLKTKLVPKEREFNEEVGVSIEKLSQELINLKSRKEIRYKNVEELIHYLRTGIGLEATEVLDKLSKIKNLQLEVTRLEYEKAVKDYYVNRIEVIIAIIGGICLTLAFSFPLIRTITISLKTVTDELAELAKGEADLNKRIPLHSSDEIGKLSENFNQVMDRFSLLVRKVLNSDKQVRSVSTTVSSEWNHLEASVERTGILTGEISSNAKGIADTSLRLVSTMDSLSKIASQTEALANDGRKGLKKLEIAMEQVEKASKTLHDSLLIISEKTENINMIVTTITKVADQTNLLSLNAAIEAEKAGEYGIGFSIVAREIRRLADQTAEATLDIEQTVKEVKQAVSYGVSEVKTFSKEVREDVVEVRDVGVQMSQITEYVQELIPHFKGVHEGVQVQARDAKKISGAMKLLINADEKTNDSLRRSLKEMRDLYEAVEDMHNQVSLFKIDDLK